MNRSTGLGTAPVPGPAVGSGGHEAGRLASAAPPRLAYADNLKVALVAGVIVAHTTMAWTGLGGWVFDEPPVREPLRSLLLMAAIVGTMFGMSLFFLVAGMFTPASLERKGPRRFALDRTVRLLVPILFFVLLLSPPIEYVDPSNAGWTRGFWAFVPHVWWPWPPPPGPTWFLGVLLVFSLAYALLRTAWPRRVAGPAPLRGRLLVLVAAMVAAGSYLLRLAVSVGEEVGHVAVAQAPGWVAGFALGVLGAERGWFQAMEPGLARRVRRVAWTAMAACAATVGALAATGADIDLFSGGGTWQSLLVAVFEGAIMVTASLWLVDLFRRRVDRQGGLARRLSRAAYAAFLVHQIVLVGLVLASRQVPGPPELEYLIVSVLGVGLSFGLGAVLVRTPGVSRIV